MRMALAVGIHRKRPGQANTTERELWTRAFWGLLAFDTLASMFLGRPRAISLDEYVLSVVRKKFFVCL